jgi:hypothetical protein
MVTREIFYDRIFPAIAVSNDFSKDKRQFKVTSKKLKGMNEDELRNWGISATGKGDYVALCDGSVRHWDEVEDITKYEMPSIHWHKQLKPEADQAYMEMLSALTEKGVPISIRMLAAAGGVRIDDIINGFDEDKEVRTKIAEYLDEIKDIGGPAVGPQDEQGGEFSSIKNHRNKLLQLVSRTSVKPIGVLGRTYDESMQPKQVDKSGKLKSVSKKRKKEIDEKMNRAIARLMAEKAKESNRRVRK